MADLRKTAGPDEEPRKRRPPARTAKGREDQLVMLAYDLAEQQLLDGTASSQVMTQFLKIGTQREILEREKLAAENKLAMAKVEQMASSGRIEELYTEALKAFSNYQGKEPDEFNEVF